MPHKDRSQRPRIFYGWYIVAAGMTVTTLQGALFVYGFGAFFTHFQKTFNATSAQISGVTSLARLEGGLMAPVSGYLIDRFGPRRLMLLGFTGLGLGFILLSFVDSLVMLYVVFVGVMATSASFGTGRPVQVALMNWFIRKRGRVMGLHTTGFAIGASLIFILAWAIETFGWRAAAAGAGVIMMTVGIPVSLIIRHRPEDMGLLPDGTKPAVLTGDETAGADGLSPAANGPREIDLTPKQALRTRNFWLLVVVNAVWAMFPAIITVHHFPYLIKEVGISYTMAGLVVSAYSFISIFGRLGFGWLGDVVSIRYLMAVLFVAQALGLAVMSLITSPWQIPFYILLMAPAYGGVVPLRQAIQGHFFGRRSYGTISGLLLFADLPMTVAAPVLLGWLSDIGSYRLGFQIVAALTLIGAVAVLATRKPQAEERRPTVSVVRG